MSRIKDCPLPDLAEAVLREEGKMVEMESPENKIEGFEFGTPGPVTDNPSVRPAPRPWTAGEEALLVRAYRQGATPGALAEEFSRSKGAVLTRLKRMGVLRKEKPPGFVLRGKEAHKA